MSLPETTPDVAPPERPHPLAQRLLMWFAGSLLAAVIVSWLAYTIKLTGQAPEVLFPIAVGLALGYSLVGLARYSHLTLGRWGMLAALGWGALALVGQQTWRYLDYRKHYAEMQNSTSISSLARVAAAEFEPASFAEVLRADVEHRGPWLFGVDVLATVLVPAVVVAWRGDPRPKSPSN